MFARYLRLALTVEQIGYCDRTSESAVQYAVRLLSVYASATLFFGTQDFLLILSPKNKLSLHDRATPITAKAAIPPALISVIASPTPSPRPPASRSSSEVKTSAKPTSNLPCPKVGHKVVLDLSYPGGKISAR